MFTDIDREEIAYRMCGSCPCEDCELDLDSRAKCVDTGAICKDKIEWDKLYNQFLSE